MRFRSFDWDVWNVDHVARHHVEPSEAEAACRGHAVVRRGRSGSYVVYGRAEAGRYLFVVARVLEGGVARIITARDMTQQERRFYHGRY